jgi:hypothetical protein
MPGEVIGASAPGKPGRIRQKLLFPCILNGGSSIFGEYGSVTGTLGQSKSKA